MISHGLVVESRFSARKELVRDLSDGGIAHEIIEAQSIDDGLFQLESRPLDACFVGPTISETVAVRFLQEGAFVSRRRDCAFIVVLDAQNPSPALFEAGAHASIVKPYTPRRFTEIVHEAIIRAKGPAELNQLPGLATGVPSQYEIAFAITQSASSLRAVSEQISRGKLCLQRGGNPSLATRDAIRLALEEAFPENSDVNVIGSFDNHVVNAIVQWFSDRVSTSHAEATRKLRNSLLAVAPPKKLHR